MKWLYENWMKATIFLAVYSFILLWLYVKEQNFALFLIWLPFAIYTICYFLSNNLVSTTANVLNIVFGIIAQASMMIYGFGFLVPQMKREGYAKKK